MRDVYDQMQSFERAFRQGRVSFVERSGDSPMPFKLVKTRCEWIREYDHHRQEEEEDRELEDFYGENYQT